MTSPTTTEAKPDRELTIELRQICRVLLQSTDHSIIPTIKKLSTTIPKVRLLEASASKDADRSKAVAEIRAKLKELGRNIEAIRPSPPLSRFSEGYSLALDHALLHVETLLEDLDAASTDESEAAKERTKG